GERRGRGRVGEPPSDADQATMASPFSSRTIPTRPGGAAPSTGVGAPKCAPASLEKAASTRGLSPAAVNHTTATERPSAAAAGPLTGQPAIFHPSAATGAGFVQPPELLLTTAMSRISLSLRSRYTTRGP